MAADRGCAGNRAVTSHNRHGLYIGRYFGIEFYLHFSWFFIAAIITYELATVILPAEARGLPMAVAGAALFFLSLLLHELGHSLVSQRCGIPVPRITLLFIGGIAEIAREPDDAKSELKIALGGPAVSVVLAGLFALVARLLHARHFTASAEVADWLAVMNLTLVIFNMIPGYPLDGGRVLRALLWARTGKLRRATFITSRIGIAFSWVLVGLGVFLLVTPPHQWNAFVFLLIGMFLKSAAESGYANAVQRETLAGVRVRDFMTGHPDTVPDDVPLSRAVDEFFLAHHHKAFPVCSSDGEFRGLLRLDFLKPIPREKWPYTSTGDVVAQSDSAHLCIDAGESAARAMRLLLAPGTGRLAVVENGKVVGIVTRRDVARFIDIRTELED